MVSWLRLAVLAFAFFAAAASAAIQPGTQWRVGGLGYVPTQQQACEDYRQWITGQTAGSGREYRINTFVDACELDMRVGTGAWSLNFDQKGYSSVNGCPANSTLSGGSCVCSSGYAESNGMCVQNQCASKTGQVGVISFTEGYSRTPDEGDRTGVGQVNTPPADGNFCDGGCNVSAQLSGPGVTYYVSQSPTSNGLYRRSRDMPTVGLGTACTPTAADAAIKTDTPPPPCPGSVGEFNGKPACFGTAQAPVVTQPLGNTGGSPSIAGNPPAGAKPVTGEGSGTGSAGRTPTAGNGTASGGPAAAAVGGAGGSAGGTAAGTGTAAGNSGGRVSNGSGGTEQANCGAPGQPKCAIDESGTTEAHTNMLKGIVDASKDLDKSKEKYDGIRDKAASKEDKGWLEPLREMFWSPPIAGCSPFALPSRIGLSIDPCDVVDGVRGFMAFIWGLGGFWLCLGMIKRSI